jgi:hypothetical protein
VNYDVFISHSQDHEIARAIYDYLSANGIKCFLDTACLQPGELFTAQINEARESCSAVILVLSRNSDSSIAVNNELNGLYKKKKIIPVRIEHITPRNLLIFIGAIKFLDAYDSPFEKHLPDILSAVSATGDKLPPPPLPPTPPAPPPTIDVVSYLKKYFKELALNYPVFDTNEERMTIEEHSRRVVRLFDRYLKFNGKAFPENIIARDKFRVILALHDIGMAKVAKSDEIKIKYEIAQKSIQWLVQQPDFQDKYGFNQQEERISLALVSSGPVWRYLNNSFDIITCVEQILAMALEAGIEPDHESLNYFCQLTIIYYICDAGSYSKIAGGDQDYDFIIFDDTNKEIKFAGEAARKIAELENVVDKIVKGAILFTKAYWKPIKQKYLSSWVSQNISRLKMGKVLEGEFYKYRYNSDLERYETHPLSNTELPALKDPHEHDRPS